MALISGMICFALSVPAFASTGGTIHSGGGSVNLRAGPGTNYPITGTIAQGTAVSIDCVGWGTAVSGPYGTTTLWDEIGNSRWVTDAFVQHRHQQSDRHAMPHHTLARVRIGQHLHQRPPRLRLHQWRWRQQPRICHDRSRLVDRQPRLHGRLRLYLWQRAWPQRTGLRDLGLLPGGICHL